MTIDLTKREIELLLMLIEDATKGKFSPDGESILTDEEEIIIKKLKGAQMSTDKISDNQRLWRKNEKNKN